MGRTQNANESLHSVVWSKCPKTTFVGVDRVVSATCSAVSEFNAGIEATIRHLCDVMELPACGHLLASAEKADHRRLGQAKRQAVAATKEVRQAKRIARTARKIEFPILIENGQQVRIAAELMESVRVRVCTSIYNSY